MARVDDGPDWFVTIEHRARKIVRMRSVYDDLRYATRSLMNAKEFTVTASLTLAVGVAGVTLMFALVDGLLLQPLPVRDGLLGALATGGFLRSLLNGVRPVDPLSTSLAVTALLLTAVVACLLPARRAVPIDPARLLRES